MMSRVIEDPCAGMPIEEAAYQVRLGRGVMWQQFGLTCFLPYPMSQLRKIEVPVRVWLTNTRGTHKDDLVPSELFALWEKGKLLLGVYRRCSFVPLTTADLRGYEDEKDMDTAAV